MIYFGPDEFFLSVLDSNFEMTATVCTTALNSCWILLNNMFKSYKKINLFCWIYRLKTLFFLQLVNRANVLELQILKSKNIKWLIVKNLDWDAVHPVLYSPTAFTLPPHPSFLLQYLSFSLLWWRKWRWRKRWLAFFDKTVLASLFLMVSSAEACLYSLAIKCQSLS